MVFLIVRALFGYFIVGLLFVVFFPVCFVIACLPKRLRFDNHLYYLLSELFYKTICWVTFLPKFTIIGKENIGKNPAIIVANHQSALDIPILGSLLGHHPHIWLFWVKFAKIPVIGFALRRMNVVVDPSSLRKLVQSLDVAMSVMQHSQSHVIIFPEAGRFIDNKIHNFFHGFAILAKETGRPVVPVLMLNLNKIYPPHAFLLRPYPLTVIVGKPFFCGPDESELDFVQRVHTWFMDNNLIPEAHIDSAE